MAVNPMKPEHRQHLQAAMMELSQCGGVVMTQESHSTEFPVSQTLNEPAYTPSPAGINRPRKTKR